MAKLYSEITGSGADLIVVLHGLGATAGVWSAFTAARPTAFAGRILALDLPGHGGSARQDDYGIPAVADCVAEAVQDHVAAAGRYCLVGHSFGGAIALALAGNRLAKPATGVFALGIKSLWTEQEIGGMHALATKPPKSFASRDDALAWYAKVVGLAGLVENLEQVAARGVGQNPRGEWKLAVDPQVNAIAAPDLLTLTRNAQCPFSLGYGADDRMVNAADLRRYDPDALALPGGGHNVMVTHPAQVWSWIISTAGSTS